MTHEKIRPPRAWPARLIAGTVVAVVLALGFTAGPAHARWDEHRDEHRSEHREWHRGWSGGYWGAPPVVYGNPYRYGYYPPAAVYGPGIGINLPGVSIGIR
ncbi:MAG TPA: hypothetical protein VFC56_18980 [Stellaceae bacterium]|nr:hypothetical protein [Stellaceae bacterium]